MVLVFQVREMSTIRSGGGTDKDQQEEEEEDGKDNSNNSSNTSLGTITYSRWAARFT
jgi:hypothetical protein